MSKFCLLLGIIYFLSPSQGQVVDTYNSTVHKRFARSVINMKEVLYLEEDLAVNLEQYVAALSQKANTIKMGIQEMMAWHEQMLESELEHGWDPFNSYSLIRHMQADWMMWQLFMKKPVGLEKLDYLKSKMQVMPQHLDLKDTAEGIWRLQEVYGMSASNISQGLLDGVQYNASLTARDCLEMARQLMSDSHWNRATEWLNAGIKAWKRAENQSQPELQGLLGTNHIELYKTLAQELVKLNESEEALTAYRTAVKHYPYDAELFQELRLAETELLTRPRNSSKLADSYDVSDLPQS